MPRQGGHPPPGVSAIQAICPTGTTVVPTTDLPNQNWFRAMTLQLAGRGSNPVAYLIPLAGKNVLFSGRIPILFDHYSVEGLSVTRENAIEYLLSINQLEALKPDLWLPAVTSEDQNSNLYDYQWKYIITDNYRVGRSILEQQHR
ncbi:MAG: hypothetical protein JWN86_99 [Planctomycetota bacterium]|nr:hypothetical protein [Planctomycetota bacterium]